MTSNAPIEESQRLLDQQPASRWVSAGSGLWVASGTVLVQLPPLALEGHGGPAAPLRLHCGMGLVLPRTGWVRLQAHSGARVLWRRHAAG